MKISNCLAFCILLIVSTSCKKEVVPDEIRTGTFEQRIARKWKLTEVQYEGSLPNPVNANQSLNFTGEGEDVYGDFDFHSDHTADYEMGFTARINVGGEDPVRLPFYRPGSGTWWTKGQDSVFVAENVDTLRYKVIYDSDYKQTWHTIMPIKDSISNTFVDVSMQVVLTR